MPKSILMYPDAAPLAGEDLFYLVKGVGGSDRDRKLTLEALRQHFTTEDNEFREVTLAPASPGAVTTVDVTGTKNVTLVVRGSFPSPTDNRLDIVGTITEGCSVTVLNGHLGILDLRVQGNAPTTTPEELDFGFLGRAELVSRDGAFLVTVLNDSRWNKLRLGQAITDEATARDAAIQVEEARAVTSESALSGKIGVVAHVRHSEGAFVTATQAVLTEVGSLDLAGSSGEWEVEVFLFVGGTGADVVPYELTVELSLGGTGVMTWTTQRAQYIHHHHSGGPLTDLKPVTRMEVALPKRFVDTTGVVNPELVVKTNGTVGNGGGASYDVKCFLAARRINL